MKLKENFTKGSMTIKYNNDSLENSMIRPGSSQGGDIRRFKKNVMNKLSDILDKASNSETKSVINKSLQLHHKKCMVRRIQTKKMFSINDVNSKTNVQYE